MGITNVPNDDQKPQSDQLEIALARVAAVERENQELRAKLMAMEKQLRRLLRRPNLKNWLN